MNITYRQNGDYLIPNIVIRKTKPIGHYGRLRKAYLEMHRPILFNELVLSDKLFEHCAEIDEAARNRMELIVRSLAEQNGVTEHLKAENQMEWVRQISSYSSAICSTAYSGKFTSRSSFLKSAIEVRTAILGVNFS